jgi:biotin operon repressor
MSLRYLIAAFAARVGNPSRKLVLLKLADNANDDGICWPSAARIASDTELSRDSVKRHIKGLECDSIISVRRRVKDGVNLPSVYELIGLHAAVQGWGHSAPTRGNQHSGVGAESTRGGCIMHPEPFTEPTKEAAARAPARTAGDAAATPQRKQDQDQGRRRRGDETILHGVEVWTPADTEGLQALIDRHGAERVEEVAGGLTPAVGHRAPYLSAVVAAFQALASAEAQAAAEVIRQARLAASPSIDPEARERGAQVLATIRGRRQRRSTECEEVST